MNIETAVILKNKGYSNVFVVDPPDGVSDYILVSSSGGTSVGIEEAGYSRPSIQILVANKSYLQMKKDIDSIKKLLYTLTAKEIQEVFSHLIEWEELQEWQLYEKWKIYLDNETGEEVEMPFAIQGFDVSSDILELGKDEQLRYINSVNFDVQYNIT